MSTLTTGHLRGTISVLPAGYKMAASARKAERGIRGIILFKSYCAFNNIENLCPRMDRKQTPRIMMWGSCLYLDQPWPLTYNNLLIPNRKERGVILIEDFHRTYLPLNTFTINSMIFQQTKADSKQPEKKEVWFFMWCWSYLTVVFWWALLKQAGQCLRWAGVERCLQSGNALYTWPDSHREKLCGNTHTH